MGISSLPAPSEGVLTLLLVNTALSISLLKEVIRSILHVVGLDLNDASSDPDSDLYLPSPPMESFTDRFRSRVKPVRFGRRTSSRDHAADCRVCLARFDPDSVVNHLPCGHLFHSSCLEKWLDYQHVTCPLCRTQVMPAAAAENPSRN